MDVATWTYIIIGGIFIIISLVLIYTKDKKNKPKNK